MSQRYHLLFPISILLLFFGCNSYIQRTVWQSLSSIGSSVPPAPHIIEQPLQPNVNLAVAWIGHATTLIQIHDKIFITDPVFTDHVGMIVKRRVEAGIDLSKLAKVDFILISHLHFDHLNYSSLEMLPKNGALIFPNGLAGYVPDFNFQNVYELKSWESIIEDSVRITAVPAQHFNGRYGFDRGWIGDLGYSGYVIEYRGIAVFFAGDTGYNPDYFSEVGRRFKIDLAIVPIAPSFGDGLGSYVHVSPGGAFQIFKDVKAQYLMPIHFGTFMFGSSTDPNYPLNRLLEIAAINGIASRIVDLDIGQERIIYQSNN